MTNEKLLELAEEKEIDVQEFNSMPLKGLAVRTDDDIHHIAINKSMCKNSIDEKETLAHEIGHCETGSLYCSTESYCIREKCEENAKRWTINTLIPFDKLLSAVKSGYTECWEIADKLDVTCQLVQQAFEYYINICGYAIE